MKINTFYIDGQVCKVEEKDLKDFLFESQARHQGSDPRKVPLFSLYKSYEESFYVPPWDSHSFIYRRIDYKNNAVKIIVTELDYHDHWIVDDKSNTELAVNDDAERLFNRTVDDQDILFSYVSTSGKGVRIGFKVGEAIRNEAQYITNLYYYTKMFKDRHDKENLFLIDFCCCLQNGNMFNNLNHSRNYWFPPMNSFLSYNEEARSLITI